MTREEIVREIESLERVECLVKSNQGTYGASECLAKVGCGDPAFGDRCVYETVGGGKRITGPDPKDAPGRMLDVDHGIKQLNDHRATVAELRRKLRNL